MSDPNHIPSTDPQEQQQEQQPDIKPEPEEELEASNVNVNADVDDDMDIDIRPSEQINSMNLDGPADDNPDTNTIPVSDPAMPIPGSGDPVIDSSKASTKKDATLREFLGKMDDYAPIVRLISIPTSYISPIPQFTIPCATSSWSQFNE